MKESTELIRYLESLIITQGPLSGQKMRVFPWQKRFVRGFLGSQLSALSMGRGNGKTAFLAGIAAACLNGPLAKKRGECLLIAGSFSQAKTAFEHVQGFVGNDSGKYRIYDSGQVAEIMDRETGARVKCHGATPRLIHSRAPAMILADEISSWEGTKVDAMISGLLTGLGKIKGGRAVFLGTRPGRPDHPFQKMLDGVAGFSMCFACPREIYESKPFTMAAIRKANPSLDYLEALLPAIKEDVRRAKMDSAMLQHFLALRLNAGVPDVLQSMLLEANVWKEIEGAAPPEGSCIWGVDLGESYSQSAISCLWQSGRLECVAAFPAVPSLPVRALRDGVGSLYRACSDEGELLILGNHSVDVSELIRIARARWGPPARIVADSWRRANLFDALAQAELDVPVEFRRMGPFDGGEDVREFRKACIDRKIKPVKSLLLRASMAGARCVTDGKGNTTLQKRWGARDDAAQASILCVSSSVRIPLEEESEGEYKIISHSI